MSRNILVLSSLYNYHRLTQYIQYLAAYPRLSRHTYYFHNFVYNFDPDTIDFDSFDAVMVPHNFSPFLLSNSQVEAFAKTRALKMVFLQDEYQEVNLIADTLGRMKVDLVFSCVSPEDFDVFYPQKRIPTLKGVHPVLTGYVDNKLRQDGLFRLDRKTYDVGYRGRISPYFLGELGHEKLRITEAFGKPARAAGLRVSISVNESDRLYGDQWLEFLASCRTQLGTPSGSSVIDLTGRIMKETASYRRAFPRADFDTVRKDVFKRVDGRHVVDTVSPRMFEAAATGSAMVQLEGRYGGLLEPGEHYIELKSGYTNVDEVIEAIRDESLIRRIATQAHDELIASGRFDFERHIERFDDLVDSHLASKPPAKTPSRAAFRQDVMSRHGQNFGIDEDGLQWYDTLEARRMRRERKLDSQLRDHARIGPMLARTGGTPHVKVAKGKVARELIRKFPPYRNLLVASALFPSLKPETVLRDIFVLGIVQAGPKAGPVTGMPLKSRLVSNDEGDVVIETRPTSAKFGSRQTIGAGTLQGDVRFCPKDGGIWVDFAQSFPLGDYASTLIIPSYMGPLQEHIRSDSYLEMQLPSLTAMSRVFAGTVAKALALAVSEKDASAVEDIFRTAPTNTL